MPQAIAHPAALPDDQLLKQCQLKRLRRGGPGGQHRNKVETAVVVQHTPSGKSAEANERRSQEANRQMALFRLRVVLALEPVEEFDLSSSPSELWKSRVRSGKLAVNPGHTDFPSLLAEAISVLTAFNWNASTAASHLGCSSSQLVKFLKNEPSAFTLLNAQRQQIGLKPLK